MTALLRIHHFAESANQAFRAPVAKCLSVDDQSLSVHLVDPKGSSSQEMVIQNKKTWKVFQETLVSTIGQKKFDWICQRYYGLNFTRRQALGLPLRPEDVQAFAIGSSQLLGGDVKARFPEKLKTLTREQLTDRIRQVQPFGIVGEYRDPRRVSGAPHTLCAYLFHNKIQMDKEKQWLFSDAEGLTPEAWLERFSKVTVNRELIEDQLLPAPGLDGRIDYYKVYRKIATGDGLVAYALKPATANSTLKPLIVFRPSQFTPSNEDAFETYMNDVQPSIGMMGWKPAIPHFRQLMQDPHFRRNNEKVSIAGYSLGGAHAQYFLAEHVDNVARATFYNDPSVNNATAERFAYKMRTAPARTEPLEVELYRTQRDICHYTGGKHVIWGVDRPDVRIRLMEIDHANKKITALSLHAYRIFDNTSFPYKRQCIEGARELFNHLDNTKRGPNVLWYERTRRVWGRIAYISFYCLSEIIKAISWALGIKLLRSSRDPI